MASLAIVPGARSGSGRRSRLFSGAVGVACALASLLGAERAYADNPIIQHVYTADPAPMVYGDTVYLCTSHDEDVTVDNFFTMNDWFIFSSKDMVNWTDHGSPLSWETFKWAQPNHSWAPHCVERNGKFYMFVPVSDKIGVAVADHPLGPYKDAIGAPLLNNYQYIDPTVYIDDDGQAYLYFGNPKLWYVKLNSDMISYSGSIQEVPLTPQSFGQRRGGATQQRPAAYEEGPWFYKRNDLYYLIYPTGELPEHIAYSTSPGPTGPWTYRGEIMGSENGHAFTNHPGIIDFKGRSYFFYHTQELPGGSGFKRSVAVEQFEYGADGTIPTIKKTSAGVTESVAPLNPYERVEGETMAWGQGIEVEDSSEGGRALSHIENGDYIKVRSVDFRTGALWFEASVASAGAGGKIELRIDKKDGTLIGTCDVTPTGGWQTWSKVQCDVEEVSGIHDLFLVFTGGNGFLFNLDWYRFEPKEPLSGAGGANAGGSSAGGGAGEPGGGSPGVAGTGGAPAAAGSGGSPSVGGMGGSLQGPMPGSGGAPSAGAPGADPAANPASTSSENGCACAIRPQGTNDFAAYLLAGGALFGTWFARRRRRASN